MLAGALLVLLIELFVPSDRKQQVNAIGVIAVLVGLAFVVALAVSGGERAAFGNMFVVDTYALLLKAFFLAVALAVLFHWNRAGMPVGHQQLLAGSRISRRFSL